MKKLIPLAAVAILASGLLAGCGKTTDTAAAASGSAGSSSGGCQGATLGDSIPQESDPALTYIHQGFAAEAQKHGATVDSADANLNVNQQLSDIDSFIQRRVAAVSVWPMDGTAVRPALQRAQQAGITVVTQQTPSSVDSATNIQFDDKAIGADLAAYLGDKLGPGAKVAAIVGPQQVQLFKDIADGFAEGAAKAGLEVVDTQENAQLSPQKSVEIAQQWKSRYGADLKGVFDTLNVTALAAATTRGDGFDPLLVTYQGNAETQKAVEDGKLSAIAYVPNTLIGRAKAWVTCQRLAGVTVPSTVKVPYVVADKSNVGAIPSEDQQLNAGLDFSLDADGRIVYQGLDLPASVVATSATR